MDPNKTYCRFDGSSNSIETIYTTRTKKKAEAATAKRQKQWWRALSTAVSTKRLATTKPARFSTMTVEAAVDEIKSNVKDRYEQPQF
jgi:hypothetical protein